jgi:hypothetical protein
MAAVVAAAKRARTRLLIRSKLLHPSRNRQNRAQASLRTARSPDGKYLAGRTVEGNSLRLFRLSEGINVTLTFRSSGIQQEYFQRDWR